MSVKLILIEYIPKSIEQDLNAFQCDPISDAEPNVSRKSLSF